MIVEKEIKILNIDIEKTKEKLNEIGAEFGGKKVQKLYTYDIPTIYYRFLEIKELLNVKNESIYDVNLKKLSNLLGEIDSLISSESRNYIQQAYDVEKICEITFKENQKVRSFVNDCKINDIFKELKINPNKWIRLRKSNDKVELTVKHILNEATTESIFQNVTEKEIVVSSFENANELLESLGFYRRNYQEKIRYSYKYKNANIEIDIWPKLNPYLEVECDDPILIKEVIDKLDLSLNEVVSFNTEILYKRIGIDIKEISNLKFNNSEIKNYLV